jgi:alpha-glucosidase (family GH31 glycosyl hydrolase)
VFVALALATVVPGASVADAQVSAGSLGARVAPDPWHLSIVDGSGGSVLEESAGQGPGPSGTLGFRSGGVWFHATRVAAGGQQGGEFVATLETTDPLHDLEVRIHPASDGVIRLTASVSGPALPIDALGIGFQMRPGERYLGFGERSTAVDQRGREVQNYVADGPYEPEERPIVDLVIPDDGFSYRDDATYFPMPWLLSTRGYGVLVNNTETSYFRLGSTDAGVWSLEAESDTLDVSFIGGTTPADALRRMTGVVGRQPAPAAPWVFGPWYQPTGSDRPGQARSMRDMDVPGSAVNTYLHYLPCGAQQGVEAQQPPTTKAFHDLGYAITTYFNPMVCTSYSPVYGQAEAAGVLTKDQMGDPYVYQYAASPTAPEDVSQFDFSAPGATAFYGNLLAEAVGHGYDGWMEDFGEYTPLDSMSANGMSGERMHNLYPTLYHCASRAYVAGKPLAPFVRSGWTGTQACAQIVWGGDPTTDWGYDGLDSSIKQALSMGTSGISRWGSDIGGFFSLIDDRLTAELLIRWIEFGAASGVMRTEANGVTLNPYTRPQIFDASVLPVWKRYAKLRTQLYPYLAAADAEYLRTGMPTMRHLALTHPGDPTAMAQEDEYMFGPDLLAAPVHTPGATTRSLYAPGGRWIDFWDAISYVPEGGAFHLEGAKLLRGGGPVTVPAPLGRLPLLIRAGAILPLLPPSVDTLAPYGSDATVRLDEVRRRLHLLAFPRGRTSSPVGDGGKLKSKEKKGRWRLGIVGVKRHRVELEALLTTLKRDIDPCVVRVGGKQLKRKAWSEKKGVLTATFRTRRKGKTRVVVLDKSRCNDGPRR